MRTNKLIKNFLVLGLIGILTCSFTACKSSKEGNTSDTETVGDNVISYYVDGDFKSKINLTVPEELNEKCNKKMSSSFTEGYCEITFFITDTDYNLFTVYCSKDDKYKNFKDEHNYEVLGNDGTYTFIWYEYEYKDIKEKEVSRIIKEFQSDCKNIKSSFKMEK